jgi:hypothetical protein
MTERDYEIVEEEWENTCQIRITNIKNEEEANRVIQILQEAEIVFDKVFIEFERVYSCLYDCLFGRLVTA